ncbi:DUF58 domain-containing protein [Bacillus rubiinfantis]|uniref:DUF58 domain-containing protein n=1 Tax=Bacillus rubiinfantis TaxID=1499680 RepID=UPI0005A8DA90|nr:DUF58 domain-containing protein [Bacillus rubiinfantis]
MIPAVNPFVSKLQMFKLSAKVRRRGIHKGGRVTNKFGSSLEFSDFRLYQPGDDIRHIDWNLYGRTQKHYIKRFLDEQEMSVSVFLDGSQSMQVIGSKWQKAKELAAVFSYIALAADDRLSFSPVTLETSKQVKRKGAVYGKQLFLEVLQLKEKESNGTFTENFPTQLLKHNQLVIIISDGLEELESFAALFHKLAAAKQEVRFIQLLSKQELEPSISGDVKLIDSETKESVNLTLNNSTLANYRQRVSRHCKQLEHLCRRYGFTYLFTTDESDVLQFLLHDCKAKKVVY